MNGELLFNNTKCYFNFDNNVLEVFCLNGEAKTNEELEQQDKQEQKEENKQKKRDLKGLDKK